MKMFIPEIGTKIILSEDFYFTFNGEDAILKSGMRLVVRKIVIKQGQSHTNHIKFNVPKYKCNSGDFLGSIISIILYELNDMDFEFEDYNDDTKKLVYDILQDVQNITNGLTNDYKKIESILLNGKNLISFFPHQVPLVLLKSLSNRLEKRRKEVKKIDYKKILDILNKYIRKTKIEEILNIKKN